MKEKKGIFIKTASVIVAALIVTVALGQFAGEALGADTIVLKGVTALPRNSSHNMCVPLFQDMVYKKSNNRLKIDWIGGPEAIKTFDQADALRRGVIDMLLYHPRAYFKSLMPGAEAAGLSRLTAWEERKSGCFELWVKVFREQVNAEYLGRMSSDIQFLILTNVKIEKLEDFKGKRFRGMPLYMPFFKAMGINMVTTPPPEIYTAMERKVVDGFMWPALGIYPMGWHEVSKYLIEPAVPMQVEASTVVNLDKFNKLPKDLQDVLRKAMEELEPIAAEQMLKKANEELELMKKAGLQVIQLPPGDAKKFTDLVLDATWEKVIADDPNYGPQFKKCSSK